LIHRQKRKKKTKIQKAIKAQNKIKIQKVIKTAKAESHLMKIIQKKKKLSQAFQH